MWDYELNGCSPKDVGYASNKKYWFKCPRKIHPSEARILANMTHKTKANNLKCNQCESFGQYLLDEFGENALDLYWDYEMNKVNPFEISKCSHTKVYIKCQEVDYHESYLLMCKTFVRGDRCPYCNSFASHKVHPKDSFGQMLVNEYENLDVIWDFEKNGSLNPFGLAKRSTKKVWLFCQKDEEHNSYKISCDNYFQGNRCPKCKESKGERRVREMLNTYNINYIAQKVFPNLLGIGNRNLSYDFYLPDQNLLIEYQGQYHDGMTTNQTEQQFLKQQEHDRHKREYAEQNGIRLLEIWYWDFDNIEEILNENIK